MSRPDHEAVTPLDGITELLLDQLVRDLRLRKQIGASDGTLMNVAADWIEHLRTKVSALSRRVEEAETIIRKHWYGDHWDEFVASNHCGEINAFLGGKPE